MFLLTRLTAPESPRFFVYRILSYTSISGPIKFLIRLLKKSLGMVRHKYFGFSSAELAEGLTQIAVNDNNKKTVCQAFSFCSVQVFELDISVHLHIFVDNNFSTSTFTVASLPHRRS